RVPDVVAGIHGDAEGTGIGARQDELGDRPGVSYAPEPVAAQLGEPGVAVRRNRQGGEPRDRRRHRENLEASPREAPDLVRRHLENPNGPVGADGDIAETAASCGDVERRLLAGE